MPKTHDFSRATLVRQALTENRAYLAATRASDADPKQDTSSRPPVHEPKLALLVELLEAEAARIAAQEKKAGPAAIPADIVARFRKLNTTARLTTKKDTDRTDWWPYVLVYDKADDKTQGGYSFVCSLKDVEWTLVAWEKNKAADEEQPIPLSCEGGAHVFEGEDEHCYYCGLGLADEVSE